MARRTTTEIEAAAQKATEAAENDPEASADVREAARAVDNGTKAKKAPRERKYSDEIVKRAIVLRKTKGLGFLKVARAIEDEFSIKVSPAALRTATLRYKGVASLNDLPKKPKVHREVAIAASSKIDGSDEHDAAVKNGN